jgi:hypothetical protein
MPEHCNFSNLSYIAKPGRSEHPEPESLITLQILTYTVMAFDFIHFDLET